MTSSSDTSSSDTSAALESVDEHMQSAKRKFTAATLACIKGMPTAERQVAEALAEIEPPGVGCEP
jgi:hypothetical protein